ncbi:MAG: dicarboxylate/amino acid:cation symporter [Erysipelotrichaceae bacterium]|nr:dicarboxylate/amino acid:cation symporter [Erysipelotrichaceae bacterium]
MQKKNSKNLTTKMLIAMVAAVICGIGVIALRENLTASGNTATWNTINSLLFADISAAGNEQAIGLFYIIGQLFVRALQLVIVPMVFTSIVLAMIRISDSRKLGRISSKTVGFFLLTTVCGILLASVVGMIAYNAGAFHNTALDLTGSQGSTGANPLMILINAVPNNFVGSLSNNGGVLAIVVTAVGLGLAINAIKEKIEVIPKFCQEVSDLITVVLSYIVNTFGPVAVFCLITRTCAAYGISHLKPAMAYVLLTVALLLLVLFAGYALFVKITTGLNPRNFVKKIAPVALFGFSTSSSAATLPLNLKAAQEDLGVKEEIASFVLPLGMTVNMDGTAIMQVIATIFIAGCSGYQLTFTNLIVIGLLAIVASVGTPAAPGAGAVILFTILSGVGINNEMALVTYSLILAINRPIEMLVTALNVVGDTACAMAVAKSEDGLDVSKYEA